MTKKIGIIIPTRNRPILLERALQCVFEQSYKNWSLTIVNDGGNQKEIETLVSYYKKKYNNENQITIHTNEYSIGKAASCNIALKKLNSEFVVILNDDDCWVSEFLQISITQLEYRNKKNPLVKGITCLANTYHEEVLDDGAFTQWCDTPKEKEMNSFDEYVSSYSLIENNQFSSSQFVFYKDVISRIGMFNEEMIVYNDWEFNIRFIAHYEIYRQTQPFVNIYKRFWTTNPAYINTLALHVEKLDYFSNKINDTLFRQTTNSEPGNKNGVDVIALQTILLLRKSISASFTNLNSQQVQHIQQVQVHQSSNGLSPQYQHIQQLVSDQITMRLVAMESKIDTQTRLNQDWFKYIEYNLKNPVYRKSKKAAAKLKNYFDKVFANK